jgi:hypothetical protein
MAADRAQLRLTAVLDEEPFYVRPVVTTPLFSIELPRIRVNEPDVEPEFHWRQAVAFAYLAVKDAERQLYSGWLTRQRWPG